MATDATLLSRDGGGHQLKLNKAGVSDTASLLYQTNWSGRAEMGLAGNDDFAIKVSADGSTFHDAVVVSKDDGKASFPSGTNGSGSSAGIMGLQTMAFTCERNGGFVVNNYLAFGNGAAKIPGAAMPFAGKVVAASIAQYNAVAGINEISMTVNRTTPSGYSVAMKVTTTTNADNTTIGVFFVMFD